MNIVAHILSAVTFGFLLYWFLESRKKHRFTLELLRLIQGESGRVVVDWPLVFLRRFADALEIPWQNASSAKTQPERIYGQSWISLFLSHGIKSICIVEQSGQLRVEVALQKQTAKHSALAQDLSAALGGKIPIDLR